jgi:hypothetical protein
MKTDLGVSFGSLFGAANHLEISLCVRGWLAHGLGVGNRGAESDRATDRSIFVVGLIGRIRLKYAVPIGQQECRFYVGICLSKRQGAG